MTGRGVVVALSWVLASVVTFYWASVAVSLAVVFGFLSAVAFGLGTLGHFDTLTAHAWGMRFSRGARWAWLSIGRVFRAVSVKR